MVYTVNSIFKVPVFKNFNLTKRIRTSVYFQIFTASITSLTHTVTNDAQKAMGIITMALMANNYHTSKANNPVLGTNYSCCLSQWAWYFCRRMENYLNWPVTNLWKISSVNGCSCRFIIHHLLFFAVLQHSFTYRLVRRTLSSSSYFRGWCFLHRVERRVKMGNCQNVCLITCGYYTSYFQLL